MKRAECGIVSTIEQSHSRLAPNSRISTLAAHQTMSSILTFQYPSGELLLSCSYDLKSSSIVVEILLSFHGKLLRQYRYGPSFAPTSANREDDTCAGAIPA